MTAPRWLPALLVVPVLAGAQGVRVSGVTSMQAVELRPLVEDSVAASQTTGAGPYRALADGRLVRCIEGEAYCRFRSAGERTLAAPLVQDLRAVAWGLGQGISGHAHLRFRQSLGDGAAWPRAGDAFDALEAWIEVDRGSTRTRLGRQWAANGLGVYNYDGASVRWRRGRGSLEAFGGRSLVAGLNGPVAGSELGAVDDLPPDEHGWLIGLSARAPIANRGGMAATWQRVIRADHAALYSERLAADASWRALSTTVDASLTWDAAERQVNDARLRLARPLPRGMTASVEAVRHRPFFEAWTIWGAFSPVAFDEARAAVAWRAADARWGADVRGGWRSYDESGEGLEATPLKTDGWRAGAGLEWQPRPRWLLYGDYDIDVGFGASRSDAAAGVRWMPDESRWLGLVASSLQHIYEFRVGTGRITGLRVEGATRLGPEARLVLDGALYDHHLTNGAAGPDWSQRRFSLRLEWTIGRDPGAGGAR